MASVLTPLKQNTKALGSLYSMVCVCSVRGFAWITSWFLLCTSVGYDSYLNNQLIIIMPLWTVIRINSGVSALNYVGGYLHIMSYDERLWLRVLSQQYSCSICISYRPWVVGHVPRRVPPICGLFLQQTRKIECTITAARHYIKLNTLALVKNFILEHSMLYW